MASKYLLGRFWALIGFGRARCSSVSVKVGASGISVGCAGRHTWKVSRVLWGLGKGGHTYDTGFGGRVCVLVGVGKAGGWFRRRRLLLL